MTTFSLIIALFTVAFWFIRVVASFTTTMEIDFIIKPLDARLEIILLFVTLICIFAIFRRKMWGALIYLISQWGYYGVYIYNFLKASEEISYNKINLLVSLIGVLLPFIIIIDIGLSQSSKKTSLKTKKTDWFFQNEEFDRKYDERADKNQYKF